LRERGNVQICNVQMVDALARSKMTGTKSEPDMDFTWTSHGKNMAFRRERHEKHTGNTWERHGKNGSMCRPLKVCMRAHRSYNRVTEFSGKKEVGFYVGGRDVTRVALGLRGCFRRRAYQ
jgi:hypothetical protein